MNPWFKTWRAWLHHAAHGGLSRDAIYVGGMVLASECVHARREFELDAPAEHKFSGYRTPLAGPYSARESACARNANGKPATLSSLALAGRCSEAVFVAAFDELVEEGIAYRSIDGGYGLLRYWAMQESSSAVRMRRHRGRHSDAQGDAEERHSDASCDGSKRNEKRHTVFHAVSAERHSDAARDAFGDALARHSDVSAEERHSDASCDGSKRNETRHTSCKKLREREEEKDRAHAAAAPQSARAGLSPEEIRDLLPPPPLPTLTGSTRARAQNENGVVSDDEALEISQAAGTWEAFHWLNELLVNACTTSAPRLGGKWSGAYRYIGSRPAAEWLRVEACLRSELTSRRLPARQCTPGHVADYWDAYAAGEPPGAGNGHSRRRLGMAPCSSREELAADAALEDKPSWMTDPPQGGE
jgi:hypothetical protein